VLVQKDFIGVGGARIPVIASDPPNPDVLSHGGRSRGPGREREKIPAEDFGMDFATGLEGFVLT